MTILTNKLIELLFPKYFVKLEDKRSILLNEIQSKTKELENLSNEFDTLQNRLNHLGEAIFYAREEASQLDKAIKCQEAKYEELKKDTCIYDNYNYLKSLILKIKDYSSAIELEGEVLELYSRCNEIYDDDEFNSAEYLDYPFGKDAHNCTVKNYFLIKDIIGRKENRKYLEIIKKHIWLKAYLRHSPLSQKEEDEKWKQLQANIWLEGAADVMGASLADYYDLSGFECLLLELNNSSHNYFLLWENGNSYGYEEEYSKAYLI